MRRSFPLLHKVLCLSEDVVKACLDMKECLRVNRQAFVDLAHHKAVVPTRIGIPYHSHKNDQNDDHHHPDGSSDRAAADFTLFKPAAIPDKDLMAIKLVSIRQHNPIHHLPLVPATVVSIDATTGMVNGLVAGTYLTGARTATGSALSTAMYRPDVQRLVMFGAGLQARLHLQAMAAALDRPIPHVTIVNRTMERAQTLVDEIKQQTATGNQQPWVEHIEAVPLRSGDPLILTEVLAQADVIVTATNTTTPLFADSTPLSAGCHLCSVGSYTPQMQEIAARIVDQCTVVMDTPDARTVGDLQHLTAHHPTYVLGDILANQTNNSTSPAPRHEAMTYTFFKSVGTAIQDVYTTKMVMDIARERNLGVEIEL